MQIRALAESEFAIVIALARAVWPVAFAGILTPDQIANVVGHIYTPDNLAREWAAGHRFWAAFEGGEALGFAAGYRDGEAAWVKKLYILPKAQGQGIGRALIATIAAHFSPVRELKLLVNDGNVAAQAAYERLGFVRAATLPVHMGDHDFIDYLYIKPL
jgi:ribosomal protein S18 acetylase RimI-like enzyme